MHGIDMNKITDPMSSIVERARQGWKGLRDLRLVSHQFEVFATPLVFQNFHLGPVLAEASSVDGLYNRAHPAVKRVVKLSRLYAIYVFIYGRIMSPEQIRAIRLMRRFRMLVIRYSEVEGIELNHDAIKDFRHQYQNFVIQMESDSKLVILKYEARDGERLAHYRSFQLDSNPMLSLAFFGVTDGDCAKVESVITNGDLLPRGIICENLKILKMNHTSSGQYVLGAATSRHLVYFNFWLPNLEDLELNLQDGQVWGGSTAVIQPRESFQFVVMLSRLRNVRKLRLKSNTLFILQWFYESTFSHESHENPELVRDLVEGRSADEMKAITAAMNIFTILLRTKFGVRFEELMLTIYHRPHPEEERILANTQCEKLPGTHRSVPLIAVNWKEYWPETGGRGVKVSSGVLE